MKDITLAIGVIFVLGVIAALKVEPAEVITVLSYVVTAIGSLATGNALK
jgi:hypothetical protein